ncbi:MAG: hypothetical protein ACLPTQ_24335, partial [Terriglobales bacterium]
HLSHRLSLEIKASDHAANMVFPSNTLVPSGQAPQWKPSLFVFALMPVAFACMAKPTSTWQTRQVNMDRCSQ